MRVLRDLRELIQGAAIPVTKYEKTPYQDTRHIPIGTEGNKKPTGVRPDKIAYSQCDNWV